MPTDADEAPVPGLAERFTLTLDHAPALTIGTLATGGVRQQQAVIGGRIDGALAGDVVGGSETILCRPDGVDVVEAVTLVRTEAGALLRAVGTGYRTHDGHFVGTRLTIVWEVDEAGPHRALATRAWLAERPAGSRAFTVVEVL